VSGTWRRTLGGRFTSSPGWSRDGTGRQVGRVTYESFSCAPVWWPDGEVLIYSHLSSTVVDLYMTKVSRSGTELAFQAEPDLTQSSGLDCDSRAAWYLPAAGAVAP
jgi:Tol biopolymer transport system component